MTSSCNFPIIKESGVFPSSRSRLSPALAPLACSVKPTSFGKTYGGGSDFGEGLCMSQARSLLSVRSMLLGYSFEPLCKISLNTCSPVLFHETSFPYFYHCIFVNRFSPKEPWTHSFFAQFIPNCPSALLSSSSILINNT